VTNFLLHCGVRANLFCGREATLATAMCTKSLRASTTAVGVLYEHFSSKMSPSVSLLVVLRSFSLCPLQGEIVLRDGSYISDGDVHMKLEGTYVQQFGELRMVLSSDGRDGDVGRSEGRGSRGDTGGAALGSYQLGARDRRKGGGPTDLYELARNCKIRMTTQVRGGVYCMDMWAAPSDAAVCMLASEYQL
jgi:hypothetical protein